MRAMIVRGLNKDSLKIDKQRKFKERNEICNTSNTDVD